MNPFDKEKEPKPTIGNRPHPVKKPVYEFTEQKGVSGHCYAGQIFKNGKAFVFIEPTENQEEANEIGQMIADFLNNGEAQLEQAKKEKHDLRKIFDSGRFWAETYSGWFIPDKSDHDKKFNESVSGSVSVSTEKEELNKEIADFLHWINENTDLKNHDRDIESYTNRLLNIFINLKD